MLVECSAATNIAPIILQGPPAAIVGLVAVGEDERHAEDSLHNGARRDEDGPQHNHLKNSLADGHCLSNGWGDCIDLIENVVWIRLCMVESCSIFFFF